MRFLRVVYFTFCLHLAFDKSSATTAFASTVRSARLSATLACIDSGFDYYPLNSWVVLDYLMLTLLGFYTIIVITERTLVYRSTKNGSKAFSQRVALALSANETQTAIDLSKNSDSGPLPKILTEVLQIKQSASENDFDAQAFQAAAINYASAECEREMKKNLFGLGKAGKIALILGCLGTCIGILDAVGRLGFLEATEYYDDLFSIFTWQLTRSFNIFFFSLVITVPCLWFHRQFTKKAEYLLAELEADSWQLIRRLTHPPVKKIRRIKKISGATLKTEGQDASPAERNFAPIFTQQ